MTDGVIPPGLVLIVGAFLLPFVGPVLRRLLILVLPLLALVLVWDVADGPAWTLSWLGYELMPLAGDNLSRMFGTVFSIMAFVGVLDFLFGQAVLFIFGS